MRRALVLVLSLAAGSAVADVSADAASDPLSPQELAQDVENPLANLVAIPIETIWEGGAGPEDADRFALQVSPSVPFALGEDWLLVSRSVVPLLVHQQAMAKGAGSDTGLGDIETSLFLTPRSPFLGAAWGLGPILLLPTATDSELGAEAWAAGPTGAVVVERGAWSLGAIARHLWSYEEHGEQDVNATLIDPWLNHAWESGFSVTLEGEAAYDWEAAEWTVPIGAVLHQLVEIGGQQIDFGLQFLHFVERTPDDPTWSLTFTIDLLFERGGR
jgi:hypothetical protein